ncbi:hypothetical protein QBC35DRAFT_385836 [Podospora australis]|uniref:DUF8021 domain-containing protein n=1 Tax=Podospora australis TaxID=1536484 RepID=A0AAN6WVN4_9PEZI|nr:hypothetical protein QBC35DRAFT_385836 [Podospora australis]
MVLFRASKACALLTAAVQPALSVPFMTTMAIECNRTVLAEAADAYVAAQTAGSLDPLLKVAAGSWEYEENNKRVDAKKGVLTKKLKIDHRRTIFDLVACATYTEIIAASPANPYVIGTQIRHDTEGRVTLVDTVASTTKSWLFDAKKTLEYALQEKWDPIPEGKRDSRDVIKAAGDAYMDMWSSATAASLVPWGTPCARLEGGAYTGKGLPTDSCKQGIPSNSSQLPNTRRRYVIDEAMGSVSILCVWEHMMYAADSHEFRLEDGKVRYIHTMTECGGQQCRL